MPRTGAGLALLLGVFILSCGWAFWPLVGASTRWRSAYVGGGALIGASFATAPMQVDSLSRAALYGGFISVVGSVLIPAFSPYLRQLFAPGTGGAHVAGGSAERRPPSEGDPLSKITYETTPPNLAVWPKTTGRWLAETWVMKLLEDDEHRVRVEDALGVLGSLAGFSVIAALREMAGSRAALQRNGIAVLTTRDGSEYYFGDMLNTFLLEHPAESVFAQVTAPLRTAGRPVPDPIPIVRRVASTVGSDQFGIPDLPPEHHVDDSAVKIAKAMWPYVYRQAGLDRLPPTTWTNTFLHAIRTLNENSPGVLDDTMRARIVLECAFPAAHIDPETVPREAA